MSEKELNKIAFKCVCTAAWEHEHTMTYSALNGRLGFCMHTPKKEDGSFSKRSYTHYQIDGKVYKSRKKFIEALKEFNPIRVIYKKPVEEKTCDVFNMENKKMKKYKVLSVRQPYASLLVSGVKDVENRSRRTSYRGTVLIHASAKEHSIMGRLKYSVFSKRDKWLSDNIANTPDCDVMSAIIGSVDIVDCVQNHPSEWAEKGQWHWVCENARKFEHPIRDVKGKLGIWEWEGEIEE